MATRNPTTTRPLAHPLSYCAASVALSMVLTGCAQGGSAEPVADGSTDRSDNAGTTLCGASMLRESEYGDANYQDAFERVDGYYGLESVRVFYSGLPQHWPGRPDAGDIPITVSFKADPGDILDGTHDAHLERWFAEAPADRDVYWVYYHEPEDNIEGDEFSAEDYRAAWVRLAEMATEADNPRLYATQVLMSWTLEPAAERDWRDYYPGDGVLDVLAWDAYNFVLDKPERYRPPEEIFGKTVALNEELGLPYAVAETGSPLVPGDDGQDRAQWLGEVVDYLEANDALWVQYFDIDFTSHGEGDHRLRDEHGKDVWRAFCET